MMGNVEGNIIRCRVRGFYRGLKNVIHVSLGAPTTRCTMFLLEKMPAGDNRERIRQGWENLQTTIQV